MVIKPTRVIAKALLVTPKRKVLLLRRSETDERRPLQWDVPGGAVDTGEDFYAAASRETLEECGIEVSTDNLRLGYATAADTEKGNVCWLFFVTEVTEQPVLLSPEHDKSQWVDIDEALRMIVYERQQIAIDFIRQYVLA